MAALQASSLLSSSSSSSFHKGSSIATDLHVPKLKRAHVSVPNLPPRDRVSVIHRKGMLQNPTHKQIKPKVSVRKIHNSMSMKELYAIMEVVADRSEMHKNIGIQRDNWNHLLLTSVNGITMTAATMAGIAASISGGGGGGGAFLALKLSSTLLYMAATGFLMVMNKIQPSQLAEEQRNAARFFRNLHSKIKTTLALGNPTPNDVKEAMEKVLALDKSYPLPLLGTMLEKFPANVEPAVWWPNHEEKKVDVGRNVERRKNNGWNQKLEEEMKDIVGVLKRRDEAEYVRLSKIVLKVNKVLAICGPLFTGMAMVGSAFLGHGAWAAVLGVTFGALATAVNTLEHGGQVGMVFEMYRSSAGFLKLMEEDIESTLKDGQVGNRENGELFEVKVALQLGRSLSELRDMTTTASSSSSSSSSSSMKDTKEEFASKIF